MNYFSAGTGHDNLLFPDILLLWCVTEFNCTLEMFKKRVRDSPLDNCY